MSWAWKNASLDWLAFGEVGGGVEQQAFNGGRVSHTYLAPHRGLLSTGALWGLFFGEYELGRWQLPLEISFFAIFVDTLARLISGRSILITLGR